MALNLSEQDAEQLKRDLGVPEAHKETATLEATAGALDEQQKTLPIWVVDQLNAAERCEKQAQRLAVQVRRWPTPEHLRALTQKNLACGRLRAVAVRSRDDYLQEVQGRITKNDALLSAARDRVANAEANLADARRKLDPATEAGYLSVSAREIAFKQLEKDHPEIRLTAWRWWLVLLVIELLPIVLKMISSNHPPAAEAQAELAEDATRHRIRVRRLHALEEESSRVLDHIAVREALDAVTAEYTIAISYLTSFGHFAARVVQEHQRQRDLGRAYPDLAVRLDTAFAQALEAALGSAPAQKPFTMAAE
jgi:hypothetical protein